MARTPKKPSAKPVEAPVESVIAEEAIEAVASAPNGHEEVENIVPGSDITLHDGGHLLFGEKATVPAGLAAAMRGRGQVR